MKTEPLQTVDLGEQRPGYRSFEFKLEGDTFRLTVVEKNGRPPYSIVKHQGAYRARQDGGEGLFTIDGALTADAAASILRIRWAEYSRGFSAGRAAQQSDFRKVLGV